MELYLIRHTSVAVPRGTCYGWTDVPVSGNFEAEATTCRIQLAGLCFDRVYTSPLSRARLLADYCGYADAIPEPRMREMHMGDWEMRNFDGITDPELKEYFDHYLDAPTKNGESFRDLYKRVADFLDELSRSGLERVAVFCHGGPIICALVYAGLIPLQEAYSQIPDYASVTHISITPSNTTITN